MAEFVTTTQLANRLEITANRLTRWLRKECDASNPLLAERVRGARWTFSQETADRLAEQFMASAGQDSNSEVQRRAEAVIRGRLAQTLNVPLEPRVITLAAGAPVHVDAVSPDGKQMAEIFARQGELKGGQQKKVAIDTLKLITIREEHPETELVLAFADKEAAAYATGGGWVAQALRTWNVSVEIVEIPQELRNEIRAAQGKQRMVNADETADDVALDA
jgi:hypothetical protein